MSNRHVEIMKWNTAGKFVAEIYANNPLLSPYQSFEFLNTAGLGKIDKNPLATLGFTEQSFVLFDENGAPKVVAPLYAKRKNGLYRLYLRGYLTSAGHLDFVYRPDFSFEDYLLLMDKIREFYKKADIIFDRISEHSLLYKYALRDGITPKDECLLVTVMLPESYDEWFAGLSKSVRQNIRTSYNRSEKEERKIEFTLYRGTRPDKKVRSDIMHLFARRLCEHSKLKSALLEKLLYHMKNSNPMTVGIVENPGYIGATLYIDGVLAGFFDGLVGNDRRILVPRLAINIDYGKYSPGGMLINETMKAIIGDGQYTQFDLQRGDEPYKYSYGGVSYKSFSFVKSL